MATIARIEIRPLAKLPHIEKNSSIQPFLIEANTYNTISYEDFFNNHMRKNIPCIIRNIGVNWEASKKWIKNDKIDFDYLSDQYKDLKVPVTDCKNIAFDFQPRSNMKFSDYLSYWKGSSRNELLYLKDWHLRRSKPNDKFYTVPTLFASDWLNEYAQDNNIDDFMFVYMGPAGSWTPMHADVYNSFSWSVNVSGKKKWMLFPPGEEEKLKDKFKNVVLRFDPKTFQDKNVTYYEITQGIGDAIFVPSGWYHQVENEMDTISINHNWVNGTNILNMWHALTKLLTSIEKEIEGLKNLQEFPSLCQMMLKKLYGMDCYEFTKLLTHIGEKRLAQREGRRNMTYNNFALGKNHCLYDLRCIKEVVTLMTQHHTYIHREYTITNNFKMLIDLVAYIP